MNSVLGDRQTVAPTTFLMLLDIIGSNASRQTIREISYRIVAALALFVTAYSWNAQPLLIAKDTNWLQAWFIHFRYALRDARHSDVFSRERGEKKESNTTNCVEYRAHFIVKKLLLRPRIIFIRLCHKSENMPNSPCYFANFAWDMSQVWQRSKTFDFLESIDVRSCH